tara:strand:- start:3500 stop:4090 length:591 start_codon:yes stop_codon:yes gene_type:complete
MNMANKKLWQIAEELGISVLDVVKAKAKIGNNAPNLSEIEEIVSGFQELGDQDIRGVEDYLNSERSQELIGNAVELKDFVGDDGEDKERDYLKFVSEKLYEDMPESDLKNKIKPETIYQTIRNLGVIKFYRGGCMEAEKQEIPLELLRFDEDFAYNVIKGHFIKQLERTRITSQEDFNKAAARLSTKYQELKDYVR